MKRRPAAGGRTTLSERESTYPPGPGTDPARVDWAGGPPGYRRLETTIRIGNGDRCWESSSAAVLAWQVKTRSGFTVPDGPASVTVGSRYWLHAHIGPITVAEPVEVLRTVRTTSRTGFVYGTLDGHPVAGEEAFVVHRDADGTVFLTLRSLTAPAPAGGWSRLFPVLRLAQRLYRRRYLRALIEEAAAG